MAQLRDVCGLEVLVEPSGGGGGGFALLGGADRQIVYQTPGWGGSLVTDLSLVYRYGLFGLLRLSNFVANLLESFAQIYPRLEAGQAGRQGEINRLPLGD
jgi:hypothetical protein